eukprot:12417725-Heterocapsa_arctica.AAC.1
MWKDELDHLQPSRLLHMQLPTESSGELRDRRHQGGDDQSNGIMETGHFLDRGEHEASSIVDCIFPGNQTVRKTDPMKVRGSHIDEDRSSEHSQDKEDAFRLLCDSG